VAIVALRDKQLNRTLLDLRQTVKQDIIRFYIRRAQYQ